MENLKNQHPKQRGGKEPLLTNDQLEKLRQELASLPWTLVDEPLVNEYFETIEELEEVLALRCNVLREMKQEIKNLTHYHWLKFA